MMTEKLLNFRIDVKRRTIELTLGNTRKEGGKVVESTRSIQTFGEGDMARYKEFTKNLDAPDAEFLQKIWG